MTPESVPVELIRLAVEAANANDELPEGDRDQTPAHVLAAVLPGHRAMVIASIAAEPPECVVVRRADLEAYLNRGEDLAAETAALNRLRAALGDGS